MAQTQINRDQQINNTFPVFTVPTYQNGWVTYQVPDYAPAGYYKDAMGVVHLRGLIKSGTLDTAAFTLPAGCRPAYGAIFVCQSAANNAIMRVNVTAAGLVIPSSGGSGSNAWVSLEGIHFIAQQ